MPFKKRASSRTRKNEALCGPAESGEGILAKANTSQVIEMAKKKEHRESKSLLHLDDDTGREGEREESPVEVAFRKIKEMMYHHEIVPGQKLLYHELAKKLNMSITPIIQALNRLQFLNIVYSERNKGFYVGETKPEEAEELFMALEALATFLVPTIIQNLTDKKLNHIEKAMKEHVKAGSIPEYRRILMVKDSNFHLKIMECAGNKVLHNICKWILEQIYLKYRPEYMREERITEAAEEHRMLLKALREGDVKKTTRLLRQHIRNGREHVVGSLWQDRSLEI